MYALSSPTTIVVKKLTNPILNNNLIFYNKVDTIETYTEFFLTNITFNRSRKEAPVIFHNSN